MLRFRGVSHIFLFHGSRVFARLHHNQTLPARHAGISRFSRRIPEGKRGHSRGITQIHHFCGKKFHLLPANNPPGWEGAFMASCSVRSDPGMGSGHVTLQPPAWWEKGFPSPTHSQCPRRVTKLPGKKKFGFAFNPLPPQGLFQQNFPILVDLGTNPSPGRGRDGGEPQGRGENPPEIHGNGVFGIQSCIS